MCTRRWYRKSQIASEKGDVIKRPYSTASRALPLQTIVYMSLLYTNLPLADLHVASFMTWQSYQNCDASQRWHQSKPAQAMLPSVHVKHADGGTTFSLSSITIVANISLRLQNSFLFPGMSHLALSLTLISNIVRCHPLTFYMLHLPS